MVDAILQAEGGGGNEERAKDDNGGVAQRKHEADSNGPLAFLHQFASDVIDSGDVIGVYGMPESETVGEEGSAEQDREVAEGSQGPEPGAGVHQDEERVHAGDLTAEVIGVVVEEMAEYCGHEIVTDAGGNHPRERFGA
jgi:hypothetical protein